jgi:hypothetical protein
VPLQRIAAWWHSTRLPLSSRSSVNVPHDGAAHGLGAQSTGSGFGLTGSAADVEIVCDGGAIKAPDSGGNGAGAGTGALASISAGSLACRALQPLPL